MNKWSTKTIVIKVNKRIKSFKEIIRSDIFRKEQQLWEFPRWTEITGILKQLFYKRIQDL